MTVSDQIRKKMLRTVRGAGYGPKEPMGSTIELDQSGKSWRLPSERILLASEMARNKKPIPLEDAAKRIGKVTERMKGKDFKW